MNKIGENERLAPRKAKLQRFYDKDARASKNICVSALSSANALSSAINAASEKLPPTLTLVYEPRQEDSARLYIELAVKQAGCYESPYRAFCLLG